jgi:hypothetical protein
MGNFSKQPNDVLLASLIKNYVGVYIEQGVPVLDRDLNLLQDIISGTLRSVVSRFIGDGVLAGTSEFAIRAIPANNDFRILAGFVLVDGIDVFNAADLNYSSQAGVPALTTPGAARNDTVYLDVSLIEVTGNQDADLLNSGDVGLQTSVRQKVVWVVRVAEGATTPPAPADGHTHFPLARLARTAGQAQIQTIMIIDLRRQIMSLAETIRLLFLPAFATANPFSPTSGGPGANTTINGRNFNVGTLTASFFNNTASATATVSNITATTATVTVPAGFPNGPARITIANQFGSDTSATTFNVLLS